MKTQKKRREKCEIKQKATILTNLASFTFATIKWIVLWILFLFFFCVCTILNRIFAWWNVQFAFCTSAQTTTRQQNSGQHFFFDFVFPIKTDDKLQNFQRLIGYFFLATCCFIFGNVFETSFAETIFGMTSMTDAN